MSHRIPNSRSFAVFHLGLGDERSPYTSVTESANAEEALSCFGAFGIAEQPGDDGSGGCRSLYAACGKRHDSSYKTTSEIS